MCGLCGSFTQNGTVLSKRDKTVRARVIEGLIIANQVRGTDSAGVAAINYDGKFDILKAAVTPWQFVNRKDTQSLLRTDAPLLMGHTRMTSMGNDVRDENAHPFVEGSVIGAHNGIINNYQQIDRTVRVDSQAVFRLLDQHPDDYETALSKVSGSCALTWWDAREPDALFIVAHLNPLSVAIVPRIRTVYWSSVSDHLESVMRTAYGTAVRFIEVKSDTVYRIDASNIYQWQEEKIDFGTDSHYGSRVRIYDHGGYGWDDDDYNEYFGLSRQQVQNITGAGGQISTGPKVSVVGSTDGSKATDLPAAMTPEEEERYERFWNQKLAVASTDDNESESARSTEGSTSLLAMTEDEYKAVQSERFEVDDPDLMCGYGEHPLGEGGVWDNGLQIMLCKPCQTWWDRYGRGDEPHTYPLALA